MDGTIGEIRLFASNFAPRNWAFCQGQTVQLRSNTALFSILGTVYGGNGTSTFQLPDFAGRAAVGAGQGAGLSFYALGQQGGTPAVTLPSTEMPGHIHIATPTLSSPGSGKATVNAINNSNAVTPGGNYIGTDSSTAFFSNVTTSPAPMASASLEVSNVTAPRVTSVVLAQAGGSIAHNNMQPYMALNFIICMLGAFPARN